jgi:uncharacterized membrane protein
MERNRPRWPLVASIGTLAVIGVTASITFFFRPRLHERFLEFPAIVALHVILGGVYLALAPFQFVRRIRSRWPGYHRWVGRLLVAIGLVAGASGLFMAWVIPFAGWPERIILGFFGLLFLTATAKGFMSIRAGQIAEHREWMIRAFAIGLAIATDRVIVILAVIAPMVVDPSGEPTRAQSEAIAITAFTIAFTVHTVLAEAWIRSTRRLRMQRIRDDRRPIVDGATMAR